MDDKYTYLTPLERLNLAHADRDRGTETAIQDDLRMLKTETGCRCDVCGFWEAWGKSSESRMGGCHNARYHHGDGRSEKRLFSTPETYGCTLGVAVNAKS